MRTQASLVEDWYDRAGVAQKSHQLAADALDRRNRSLGIPNIVLSAIVGSSVFATIGQSIEPWHRLMVGCLSVTAAVLAALQTFMSYGERAGKHRIAAAKYGALCRELDSMRIAADGVTDQALADVRKSIDSLAIDSPNPPISVYSAAWKNWEKWKDAESIHPGICHGK
jgi:hypothetical protein